MTTIQELVEKNGQVEGNLVGVDGNIFAVIGYTEGCLKRSDWPREDVETFKKILLEGSMSSTYDHTLGMCASVLDFSSDEDEDDY